MDYAPGRKTARTGNIPLRSCGAADGIAMKLTLCKAKIHRACVTETDLNYRGSLTLDADWMRRTGILPFEKVLVGNMANGRRFETYAIAAPAGSRMVCLNGATAQLGNVGDRIVVLVFAEVDERELPGFRYRYVVLDEDNRIEREGEETIEEAFAHALNETAVS